MEKRLALIFDLHGVLANSEKVAEAYKTHHFKVLQDKLGLNNAECKRRYSKALRIAKKELHETVRTTPVDRPYMLTVKNILYNFKYQLLQDHGLVKKYGKHIAFFHKKALIEGVENKEQDHYLYPEVASAVKTLHKANFILILASTANTEHCKAIINTTSIGDLFDEIYGYDKIKAHKSSIEYYKRIVKRIRFKAPDCVMIGNSRFEIIVPRRVGLQTAFINRERYLKPKVAKFADFSVDNLEELTNHLLELKQQLQG